MATHTSGNPAPQQPRKPISVMTLVPSGDHVHAQFAYYLAMGTATLIANGVGVASTFETSTVITIARRNLVSHFLRSNCDFAWWIDSDMAFPPDAGVRLLNRGVPIVGANYRKRYFPNPNFTAMNGKPGSTTEFKTTDDSPPLEKVDCLPQGMMLVHRSVYERIPGPHYIFEYSADHGVEVGEDYYFCDKARKNGFDIWCDQELSRQVSHIGIFNFDYNLSQAADALKAGIIKAQ
jgi:hypothetical protein